MGYVDVHQAPKSGPSVAANEHGMIVVKYGDIRMVLTLEEAKDLQRELLQLWRTQFTTVYLD